MASAMNRAHSGHRKGPVLDMIGSSIHSPLFMCLPELESKKLHFPDSLETHVLDVYAIQPMKCSCPRLGGRREAAWSRAQRDSAGVQSWGLQVFCSNIPVSSHLLWGVKRQAGGDFLTLDCRHSCVLELCRSSGHLLLPV